MLLQLQVAALTAWWSVKNFTLLKDKENYHLLWEYLHNDEDSAIPFSLFSNRKWEILICPATVHRLWLGCQIPRTPKNRAHQQICCSPASGSTMSFPIWTFILSFNVFPMFLVLFSDHNAPFAQWSTERVCNWLEDFGLGQYVIFARQWVTSGHTLLTATPQDMEKVITASLYLLILSSQAVSPLALPF